MVIRSGSRWAKASALVRSNAPKLAAELVTNFVLPYAIFILGHTRYGDVRALMAASAPPLAWSLVEFIRLRKVDALSVLVLGGIALSLLAFAGGGGIRVLQLRENLVAGLVGLVFLGSAAVGQPLIYHLARAATRRKSAETATAFDALSADAHFRGAMLTATLVWGGGLAAVCATNCALVFSIPIKTYLLISGPIAYGVIGLLTAWTYWFVRRAKPQA